MLRIQLLIEFRWNWTENMRNEIEMSYLKQSQAPKEMEERNEQTKNQKLHTTSENVQPHKQPQLTHTFSSRY